MLQLSEKAAVALEDMREAQSIPDDQETRLTVDEAQTGGLALRLEFVDESPETDEVVEQAGTELHLDSRVVQPLENTIMDVREGEEGRPTFLFRSQTP